MSVDASSIEGVEVYRGAVLPGWIDINDHMNVAYYVLAFDLAVDAVWQRLGISEEYIKSQQNSTFAVECHVTYQRELTLDETFIITTQILAFDSKRIHQFMRMYHAEKGYLAATIEWMNLHVDMDKRRVSPWPEAILNGMRDYVAEQGAGQRPAEAGQKMAISSPVWQIEDYAS